MLEFSAYML